MESATAEELAEEVNRLDREAAMLVLRLVEIGGEVDRDLSVRVSVKALTRLGADTVDDELFGAWSRAGQWVARLVPPGSDESVPTSRIESLVEQMKNEAERFASGSEVCSTTQPA